MTEDVTDLKSRKRIKEIDAAAGAALRQLRLSKSMSQTALGDAVGLTFQQIQKYEKGANRISISRLCQFAEILQFSPVQFFDNLDTITDQEPDAVARLMATMSSPQISSVVENLASIDNDALVGKLGSLIETIARESSETGEARRGTSRSNRKLAS